VGGNRGRAFEIGGRKGKGLNKKPTIYGQDLSRGRYWGHKPICREENRVQTPRVFAFPVGKKRAIPRYL